MSLSGYRDHATNAIKTISPEEGTRPGYPRCVAVSLQTVADVNQMNILARRVARVALRAQPEDVNGYFSEMGDRADQLGRPGRAYHLPIG